MGSMYVTSSFARLPLLTFIGCQTLASSFFSTLTCKSSALSTRPTATSKSNATNFYHRGNWFRLTALMTLPVNDGSVGHDHDHRMVTV